MLIEFEPPIDIPYYLKQINSSDCECLQGLSPTQKNAIWESYYKEKQQQERQNIAAYYGDNPDFNPYGFYGKMSMRVVYQLKRQKLAPYAAQLLTEQFGSEGYVCALEIGGGDGTNAQKLLSLCNEQGGPLCNLTITSLNPLPQHESLQRKGIMVRSDVLAENLPQEWTNSFHLIMSQMVLGWTNLYYTLNSIKRCLTPGGVWLGFESWDTARTLGPSWGYTYNDLALQTKHVAKQLHMRNSAPSRLSHELTKSTDKGEWVVPFLYQKPESTL